MYIRGICCLTPGIKGFTDNIHVYSIVGRYLEHSRIFVFGKGESCRIFIGSGDLLNRNTQRRVEAFVEVKESGIRDQIMEVLRASEEDNEKKWTMLSDGTYIKEKKEKETASQDRLYEYFSEKTIDERDLNLGFFARLRKKLFGR